MKSAWRPIFRAEFRASLYFSVDMYVWFVTHIQHADQIPTETRIPCRRPTLVAAANRQPVACRPRLMDHATLAGSDTTCRTGDQG